MANSNPPLTPLRWYTSLQFRSLLVFCACMALTTIAVVFIVEKNSSSRIFSHSRAYTIEKGQSIVNRLGQEVTYVEGIAKALTHAAEMLPNDPKLLHDLVPQILEDHFPDSIIAGGGIWPEPFKYDTNKERCSFFWGRNSDGKLAFFNDYNEPQGRGYHNEEWYVPAKHYDEQSAYWSQSYMDPYSLEPMVTCTLPYFKNGIFSGVVTVDVKLEGLYETFAKEAKAFSGYIFAVDRNNRFLSYPNKDLAKVNSQENNPQTLTYITVEQMLKREPSFAADYDHLSALDRTKQQASTGSERLQELAKLLDAQSYQITRDYARLIALEILSQHTNPENNHLDDFVNTSDKILGSDSFNIVFKVPSAHWKIIMAVPLEQLTIPTKEFTDGLLPPLLATSVICLLVAMLATHRSLVAPIQRITKQIEDTETDTALEDALISYPAKNELGQLVSRFNQHTQSLIQARKQAEVALQAKRDFMANISHEIRTPMNGVLLSAEILTQQELSKESMHYAKIIQQSSLGLVSIIDEILDSAKLAANKLELELIDFDIYVLIDEITELFRASAELKNLTLVTNIHKDVCQYIHADNKRLRQIISNIVGNAVKFTRAGFVRMDVSVDKTGANLIIEVSDSGIGIEAAKIEGIFDQFAQGDTSITRVFGGTGLGLSISHQLCELMGGTITVGSQLGLGTQFTLSIPIQAAKKLNQASQTKSDQTPSTTEKFDGNLLLVDDNRVNQLLAKRILTKLGFNVTTANDGQEAIDIFKSNHFDIILMDLQMPILDGLEATKQIRAMTHPNSAVPIIALSAAVETKMKEECASCGMQGFVSKPFNIPQLVKALKQVPPTRGNRDGKLNEQTS